MKITDGHIHYAPGVSPGEIIKLLDETGTDAANIAVINYKGTVSNLEACLKLKQYAPRRFFLYGDLPTSAYKKYGDSSALGTALAEDTARLLRLGCDGIKLLAGKPQLRKWLPVPDFDSSAWEPYWDYAEREQVPLLWHVNDPECFWDERLVPAWAKTQGWCYDESYINNENQYRQVLNVLKRHRKLKIIFAHFFFMSSQLPRLDGILDSFPNVMTDVTPGIELIENMSANIGEAKAFFKKHGKRITYGTDIGSRYVFNPAGKPFSTEENLRRPEIVRKFLTLDGEEIIGADGSFIVGRPDFVLRGLGLRGEAAEDVFGNNFFRHTGRTEPGKINAELAEEALRLRKEMI